MRKLFHTLIVAAVCCCCMVSCNEKPRNYRFVKVMPDGKEEVEKFEASDDTVAIKEYFGRMEKIIVANLEKQAKPEFEAMYVISPDGDTLNMNEELMKKALNLGEAVKQP